MTLVTGRRRRPRAYVASPSDTTAARPVAVVAIGPERHAAFGAGPRAGKSAVGSLDVGQQRAPGLPRMAPDDHPARGTAHDVQRERGPHRQLRYAAPHLRLGDRIVRTPGTDATVLPGVRSTSPADGGNGRSTSTRLRRRSRRATWEAGAPSRESAALQVLKARHQRAACCGDVTRSADHTAHTG